MRHSLFALRALATLTLSTLSTASAIPQHVDQGILAEQTFTCSGEQSLSLCCTGRIPSNGAVEDCQESVHFMIGPTRLSAKDLSRKLYSSTVNQCSAEQLQAGYSRPVCCKAGFRPAASAPGYNGLNCIKGAVDGGSKWNFQPRSTEDSSPSGISRRESRSKALKRSALAAEIEATPLADNPSLVSTSSTEHELPEHLDGQRSSQNTRDAEPSGNGHRTQDAVLKDLLSRRESDGRSLNKRWTHPDEEPSSHGHQTQAAVLRELLTSTNLAQR